jgi:hypothetical protein
MSPCLCRAHLVQPAGSLAQKFDLGMPGASEAASGLAFQGIDWSPYP